MPHQRISLSQILIAIFNLKLTCNDNYFVDLITIAQWMFFCDNLLKNVGKNKHLYVLCEDTRFDFRGQFIKFFWNFGNISGFIMWILMKRDMRTRLFLLCQIQGCMRNYKFFNLKDQKLFQIFIFCFENNNQSFSYKGLTNFNDYSILPCLTSNWIEKGDNWIDNWINNWIQNIESLNFFWKNWVFN